MNGRRAILAIGGAHLDRRGRFLEPFASGGSTPGTMREECGGGAFNVLSTLVQLGHSGTLVSARGGDAAGDAVGSAIDQAGIEDRSAVFLDRRTASYTALVTNEGELVAGLADMGIYGMLARHLRRSDIATRVAAAEVVLVDANLAEDALMRASELASGSSLFFALAISPSKSRRLRPILNRLDGLFSTRAEGAWIAGIEPGRSGAEIATALAASGARRAIVTGGAEGSWYCDGEKALHCPALLPERVADVTGAGDALAAAAIDAIIEGAEPFETLARGTAAATIAIESPDCRPTIARETLLARACQLAPAMTRTTP